MKKVKQQPKEEIPTYSADQVLHIWVYETTKQDPQWISNKILSVTSKHRLQPHTYIIRCIPHRHTDTYPTGSKVTILDVSQKEQLPDTGFVYLVDSENVHVLDAALTFFAASRKSFTEPLVYYGESTQATGKTGLGIWHRFKNSVYDIFGQLLMPSSQQEFTSVFHVLHASVAKSCIDTYTTKQQLLLAEAAYRNVGQKQVALSPKEAKLAVVNPMYLLAMAFYARINWFFRSNPDGLMRWRSVFFIVAIVSLFLLPILSLQFGMTWDERRHNDYSKLSLNYFMSLGEDTTCLQSTIPTQEFRYYGEHFNVIAAFLYTYISPLGEYETRHMLNAVYAWLALLFAALIAKEIAGWRAGALAWLLALFSPVFLAHGMNNPTDIPFATGFAIAIYYLIKLFRTMPHPRTSHLICVGIGIGVAVGSRVGGILLYAYAGLFLGVHFAQYLKLNGANSLWKKTWPYVKSFAIILVTGHLLSVSLWPFAQQDILTAWYEAFKKSTEGAYFTYNHELFEGHRIYMANVPWYYLPKFIVMNAPVGVLLGVVCALLLIPFLKRLKVHYAIFALLVFTILFPIMYAEFKSLYYYNGWRHYLFIYPSIIALAAIGWEMLALLTSKWVSTAPIALCTLPAMWMVSNHPNETVYFNELFGGTKGAYGRYELDYYSNVCREAGEWIAQKHPHDSLIIGINNEPLTASYYAHPINPALQFQWMREYEEQKLNWDYAIITTRTFSSNELLNGSFPPKGTVHVIEAGGAPICAIVKRENTNMPLGYQFMQQKLYDSAIYYFTLATQYQTMDEEAWRMLGTAYWGRQSADTAIQCFEKAITIYPENYTAYNEMGIVYANGKKDMGKALQCFDKAISCKINYTDPYYYASAVYLNQQDFYSAIRYLERGIKYGGNRVAELYYNLAYAYANTNSFKKAEDNLLLCLTINERFGQAYQLLANVYQQQGRQSEAQQVMQRYQQITGQ